MKYSIEDIHDYLEAWKNPDIIDDYVIAWDCGYTEICIYLLNSAGCFECHEKGSIAEAIFNYPIYWEDHRKNLDELFEGVTVMTNPETNGTWWIPSLEKQGVDYFVSEEDCIAMGYTEKWVWEEVAA